MSTSNCCQQQRSGPQPMSSFENVNKTPSKSAMPNRPYATSVKAIMYSRHANTGRNTKRTRGTPGIREMIVVKEYDQMESLRELLESGARKHPEKEDTVQSEGIEDSEKEESPLRSPKRGMTGKRNEEKEGHVSYKKQSAERDIKRRRPTAEPTEDRNLSLEKSKFFNNGKENIPPLEEVKARLICGLISRRTRRVGSTITIIGRL